MSVRGKIVLVTGATAGIGRATAAELARLGARVFVHGRSWERARGAVDELRRETGAAALEPVAGDLGQLGAVRDLAAELNARLPRLDVLINNAGVFMRERVLTVDGLETTFAVNHLAPFWLTLSLLDRLRTSAPARIVNVSSTTHHGAQVDFGNLQGERHYDGYSAYALSKLGNVLFGNALARRMAREGAGVTVNALHPGVVRTNLLRAGWGGGGTKPEAGARTPVYLATDPAVASTTGLYFVDKRPTPASALARDEALQEQFWEVSEQLGKSAGGA